MARRLLHLQRLGTDKYPPFSLGDDLAYPARLEVDYPERLSRGVVLVKWWLLAIPHYLVGGLHRRRLVCLVGVRRRLPLCDRRRPDQVARSLRRALPLFTGRYPRSLYDLVIGLNRWVFRVVAYAGLMTDTYPPFRPDSGSHEPPARAATVTTKAVPTT